MLKIPFTYWREPDGKYLGYLDEYPDHWAQADTLDDLQKHLGDLVGRFSCEETSHCPIDSRRIEIAEEAKKMIAMFRSGHLTPQSAQDTIASLHQEIAKTE